MKKAFSAFLICANAVLSTLPALADSLPSSNAAPPIDGMRVLFTGAVKDISEGLTMTDPQLIKDLAAYLKRYKDASCELTGHTSMPGDTPFLMKLSEERINAVVAALRNEGIDTARLTKVPRAGLDYKYIAHGDSQENRSVILECSSAISSLAFAPQALG